MNDALSEKDILKSLKYPLDATRLHLLDTVNSTNLYCRELIPSNACHESVVIADTQTAGRGRLNRKFFSPCGTGIYMSLGLDHRKIKLPQNLLTIAAGVAVCHTLDELCKAEASIKWVNDIFINQRKVCGILAENADPYIIVGIGINVSTPQDKFPSDLKEIAGSVFPPGITRNAIIARILNEFRDIYMSSNANQLICEYKQLSLVLGKEISFTQNGAEYTGTATDINADGNLLVMLNNNEPILLKSGEISLGSQNFVDSL